MNNYQTSLHRDKQIILILSMVKAVTAIQLTHLLFPGKYGLRKCQDRLKYLSERQLIQCIERPFFHMGNIYFLKKEPSLSAIPHIISVSWIFVWLSKRFEIEYWEQEVDFGILQCDAICRIKGGRWFFIELDRVASHNPFKKPMQYNELFEKERNVGSKFLQRLGNPDRFPRIVIVTDSVRRGVIIKKIIQENNPHGLGYGIDRDKKNEIYLFDEIMKEVRV